MKWFCRHDWPKWGEAKNVYLSNRKTLRYGEHVVQERNCTKCNAFRWKRV